MSARALLLLLPLLLVQVSLGKVSTTTPAGTPDQSVSFGSLHPYDSVLATKNVFKASKIFTVNEVNVSLSLTRGVIHYILVSDLLRNGKNASVKVKSGGPGFRDVTLNFKSQRGEQINYNVILYGQWGARLSEPVVIII